MKHLILALSFLLLTGAGASAQSIDVLYETRSGGASGFDTVIVYLQSTSSNTVPIRAVNFSFAYQFSCSTYNTYSSIFPTHWQSFFQRHLIRRNLSLSYGANTYDSRWLYAIGDANLTNNSIVHIPALNTGLLEVLRVTFSGNCNSTIYMEDQSENPVNQIADANLNSVSYTVQRLSGPPTLPVEYLSWEAEGQADGSVKLDWITASEVNNDYFTIEKSFNSNFDIVESIATIDAEGSSTAPASYSFEDDGLMQKEVYYRLRQVDIDGSWSYSESRLVRFSENDIDVRIQVYPNPVKDITTVDFGFLESATIKITLINPAGKVIKTLKHDLQNGESKLTLNFAELPDGLYFMNVKSDGNSIPFSQTFKIIHGL
ncbi:MAG: T9SS type A sorting domain-containing protein [Bacteroidia bacterium]